MARDMKTKPTGVSVASYLDAIDHEERRREGDMCVTGFSSRKPDISVYLDCDHEAREALLAKLGRHKMGKSCLYIRRLADVDTGVLEQLVAESVAECKRRHG
jgi:hypothetical protein